MTCPRICDVDVGHKYSPSLASCHSVGQMQSAYSQPQAPGQYPFALNSRLGASPPRAPDSMTPSFSQNVVQNHHAQPYTQGAYRDPTVPTPVPTGPGYDTNMYRGGWNPGYDFNYAGVESWEPPASQPSNYGGYTMPNVQYSSVGQALGANNAGYEPPTNQVPSHPMDFLPRPSGAYMTPTTKRPPTYIAYAIIGSAMRARTNFT